MMSYREVQSLRELALDILELYEESEKSVISMSSSDTQSELLELSIEIQGFKDEIDGFK